MQVYDEEVTNRVLPERESKGEGGVGVGGGGGICLLGLGWVVVYVQVLDCYIYC
jgi:hypothetical protein